MICDLPLQDGHHAPLGLHQSSWTDRIQLLSGGDRVLMKAGGQAPVQAVEPTEPSPSQSTRHGES